MSLLMKALEKAAKDRGETRTEPDTAATSAESRPGLSLALELLAADTPSPRLREDSHSKGAGGQSVPFRDNPARPAGETQGRGETNSAIGAYMRDHPLVIFGVVAALFGMAFGGYVYLQIFHPGFFIRQAPVAATPAQIVQTPLPTTTPAAAQQIATAALLQSTV
ncbi:MAG TPA: hypothetical protein VFG44_03275, partial [Burkholderiales bacterium]|nr:hypothetical protein [Burkholderiales bacterium]